LEAEGPPPGEVAQFSLRLSQYLLDLNLAHQRLARLVRGMEIPIAEYAEGKELYGSDVLMKFELVPLDPDSAEAESDATHI